MENPQIRSYLGLYGNFDIIVVPLLRAPLRALSLSLYLIYIHVYMYIDWDYMRRARRCTLCFVCPSPPLFFGAWRDGREPAPLFIGCRLILAIRWYARFTLSVCDYDCAVTVL